MKSTTWLEIPGFEDYIINESGEVFDRCCGEFAEILSCSNGYSSVRLQIGGGDSKLVSLHQLMLLTFNPTGMQGRKCYINHKDGDKSNNVLSNLEWVTQRENVHHALKSGLKTLSSIKAQLKWGQILTTI